jgi:hypothetical protein
MLIAKHSDRTDSNSLCLPLKAVLLKNSVFYLKELFRMLEKNINEDVQSM